jgi:hypothetical protein
MRASWHRVENDALQHDRPPADANGHAARRQRQSEAA